MIAYTLAKKILHSFFDGMGKMLFNVTRGITTHTSREIIKLPIWQISKNGIKDFLRWVGYEKNKRWG